MKMVRFSLCAVLLSSLSIGVVGAIPLEEAIKDIEVGGMARYRYYGDSDISMFNNPDDRQTNRFTGTLDITAKVTDNLKFGTSFVVDTFNFAENSPSSSSNAEVRQFWFQYFGQNFDVKLGKMRIVSPWTNPAAAGAYGNGAVASYTGIDNFMLVGAYYNQVNSFSDLNRHISESVYGQEDLMYIGATLNLNPINVQLWANQMTNILDAMVFLDVDFRYEGLKLRAQANYAKLSDDANTNVVYTDDNGLFYGVEAEYRGDRYFVNVGYTKTDKDMSIFAFNADNNRFIQFGEQLMYRGLNLLDAQLMFIRGGVKIIDTLEFQVGYGHMDVGNGKSIESDMDEYVVKAVYDMSKNFTFSTYYSVVDSDDNNRDNDRFFIDMLYKF